jgi:hypothetical protein
MRRVTGAHLALSLVALAATMVVPVATNDWDYLEIGARALGSSAWPAVYLQNPNVQMGPLSLGLAWAVVSLAGVHAHVVVSVGLALLFGPVLALAQAATSAEPAQPGRLLLVGLLGVLPWAAVSASDHLDEVLALTLVLTAVVLDRGGTHRWPVVGLVVLAGAAKPWAVTTLPAVAGRRARDLAVATAITLGASLLVWSPVLGGIRDVLVAGYPVAYHVPPGTIWAPWVGDGGVLSSWVRLPQLIAAFAAAAYAVRRGPVVAVGVAIAVRVALDPGQWPYQFGTLIVVCLALDLARASSAGALARSIGSVAVSFTALLAMLASLASPWVCTLVLLALAVGLATGRPASLVPDMTPPR